MDAAEFFLKKELNDTIKKLQKNSFDLVDLISAQDKDNYEQLKEILNDDELAKKFMIFHENMSKLIRKKILDASGEASRKLEEDLKKYSISFNQDVELKGIVK
jgi:hypothetical protein